MARTSKSASKAGPTTPAVKGEPIAGGAVHLVKSALLIATIALASLAIQLALHPLYGTIPTSLNHTKVRLFACLFSALLPFDSAESSEYFILLGLAIWLGYAPYSSYAVGKWTTKWKNPVLGPIVAESILLVPVMSTAIALARRWNRHSLDFLPGPKSLKAVMAIGTFNFLSILETWLWGHLPLGGYVNSSNMFIAVAVTLTVGAAFSLPRASRSTVKSPPTSKSSLRTCPYKSFLPLLLPLSATLFAISVPPSYSPRLPYTRGTASPRASLTPAPPATVRVLARTHSVTGLILVGEHLEEGFRFLRVDHSLLGGRWFGEKIAPGSRNGLGDSIYSTFVLQEAVRLIDRKKNPAKDERALFIGLGVGIAAEAFIAHGYNTTIVEIDPAIYAYAREYFNLPQPDQVYLEDAREWLHDHSPQTDLDKYDYVVHDCFSGGGVPEHIFTVEFWEKLKSVIKDGGVVAVNFAGMLASDPARAIFLTLQRSFGRCRAFHDHLEAKFDETYEFFNIVFFCTPWSSTPPAFRSAVPADFLNSHLRRHVLGAFAQREIGPNELLGLQKEPDLFADGEEKWILRDSSNRLEEWQQPNAVEHWTVMREVLADVFWETY